MRLRVLISNFRRPQRLVQPHQSQAHPASLSVSNIFFFPSRALAQIHHDNDLLVSAAATGSKLAEVQNSGLGQRSERPPDERTLKLGKTLRILQAHLSTLLASPLPQEILSPHISLHLFPSTHPHLPTASGRVAYHAALWTSPITWGRVPLIGRVNLEILSERMVKNGDSTSRPGIDSSLTKTGSEKLIVRWRTCGKTRGLGTGASYKGIEARQRVDRITHWLGGDARDDEEFCGLFIFEFDEEGRVCNHIIERAEKAEGWDNGVGRVIGLTDWLLGRFGSKDRELEGLALGYYVHKDRRRGGRL